MGQIHILYYQLISMGQIHIVYSLLTINGPEFEPCDEWVLLFLDFSKRREYWLSLQEELNISFYLVK